MLQILAATTNKHKIQEFQSMLDASSDSGRVCIISPDAIKGFPVIVEDGTSFEENARIKAGQAARYADMAAFADDSGLEVEALDGAPGIYSARYAGTGDDADNRRKLLEALSDVAEEDRAAAFVCQACLAFPAADGDVGLWFGEGRCEGRIAFDERGENGFGYDSLFYLPDKDRTMAELPPEEKNLLSHRYHAMSRAAAFLRRIGE